MKDIVKLGAILMTITVISAATLAGVYSVTKPKIEEQKRLALERALTIALPTADPQHIFPVRQNDNVLYYRGFSSTDTSRAVGYAFVAHGPGYSSVIETMVGVDTLGTIIGMKVLAQVETPGLGTKVEEVKYGETDPWFTRQFLTRRADNLAVDKDGGDIDSITGATISSRALTNSVVNGYRQFRKKIESVNRKSK
jgi:electron transport complex protein RnfG